MNIYQLIAGGKNIQKYLCDIGLNNVPNNKVRSLLGAFESVTQFNQIRQWETFFWKMFQMQEGYFVMENLVRSCGLEEVFGHLGKG